MAELDLDAIRERADAATPEPWIEIEYSTGYGRRVISRVAGPNSNVAKVYGCNDDKYANAVFIAAARTDVPALCDEVERLRAERDALREVVERVHDGAMCCEIDPEHGIARPYCGRSRGDYMHNLDAPLQARLPMAHAFRSELKYRRGRVSVAQSEPKPLEANLKVSPGNPKDRCAYFFTATQTVCGFSEDAHIKRNGFGRNGLGHPFTPPEGSKENA
jgi:hypothetical protein